MSDILQHENLTREKVEVLKEQLRLKDELNMLEKNIKRERRMRKISDFFISLGGGNVRIIRSLGDATDISAEEKKFRNIGYMLILPFAIAYFSMTLVVNAVSGHIIPAIIAGFLWGSLMVIVDKTLLAQMATMRGTGKRLMAGFLRILLVIFMSLISMYFIEIAVFKDTIEEEIKTETMAKKQDVIDAAQANKDIKRGEIAGMYNERQKRQNDLADEAAGKGPSGKAGRKGVYAEKEKQVQMADVESARKTADLEKEILAIDARMNADIANLDKYEAHSLLSMMKAQERFLGKNPAVNVSVWIGRIIIILLELLALLHGLKEPIGASFYAIAARKRARRRAEESVETDYVNSERERRFNEITSSFEKIHNSQFYEDMTDNDKTAFMANHTQQLTDWQNRQMLIRIEKDDD